MFSDNIKNNKKGGFTLIELLIVVAIIGVLAGIVVISISGSTDDAKAAAKKSNLRAMATVYAQAQSLSLKGSETVDLSKFCTDMGTGNETNSLDSQVESIMETVFASVPNSSNNPASQSFSASDAAAYLNKAISAQVLPEAGCASSAEGWVVWAQLSAGKNWCIDSKGFSGEKDITGNTLATSGKIEDGEVDCTSINT